MKPNDYHLAPRQWIKNEHIQLEWVRKYLEKGETEEAKTMRKMFDSQAHYSYANIINTLEYKLMSPEGLVDLAKMKAAWSQTKYRSKLKNTDKKAYNFVLNTNIKKQLTVLAKQIDKPMNETLEDLISGAYDKVLTEKNAQQNKKKGMATDTKMNKYWPYYFNGINYYWSDGSLRGPVGGELFNLDRTPYFFNGTHFFYYNGIPRKPTIDELNRLRMTNQFFHPTSQASSSLSIDNSGLLSSPTQISSCQVLQSIMEYLPSVVRGYNRPYITPDNWRHVRLTPITSTNSPKFSFNSSTKMDFMNFYSIHKENPFSPLNEGRSYISLEKPIKQETAHQPHTHAMARSNFSLSTLEQEHLNSRTFHAFDTNTNSHYGQPTPIIPTTGLSNDISSTYIGGTPQSEVKTEALHIYSLNYNSY